MSQARSDNVKKMSKEISEASNVRCEYRLCSGYDK